ncbi:MAG: hypothetical protein LBN38_07540 [Verrucomicrobiota bacterium]|jgi:hypothetical protein|nr:hypothetical protein [Verrucomicrobiota bacterium]
MKFVIITDVANSVARCLSQHKQQWLTLLISTLIFLMRVSIPIGAPQGGLDPSWELGLNWADIKGLAFGTDVVFTYGPLYFLAIELINMGLYGALLVQFLLCCLVNFVVIAIFANEFVRIALTKELRITTLSGWLYLLGTALLLFMPHSGLPEMILVASCVLLVKLVFAEYSATGRNRWLALMLTATALLSALSLAKFSYTLASVTILGCAVLGLLCGKKWRLSVGLIAAFVGFNILWVKIT